MLLNNYLHEEAEEPTLDEIDVMSSADQDSPEAIDAAAAEVEGLLTVSAMESVSYFDGGEEAQKGFIESAELQALVEARRMSKNTYVRLNKNDDMTRRTHLASLVLAKNARDPLWNKLALNRVKERQLRRAIFRKYENKAKRVAMRSQKAHIKNMKKMPALPKIRF